ncbi:hypothetical protein NS07_v2contig00114-0004 [Nocardia seriolae]|nr:hypothetical protein NS14008_16650 [Nocardia seriolae]BAW07115.1 conserved hypothetical protein [Nocardia seriolae]GAM49581.1 hypothetical protein NS07_v2contig00114-0004 [Nocardia seriolae]
MGVALTDTVVRALRTAGIEAAGRPVDTHDLLIALMRADSAGEWDRVWLHSGDIDAIAAEVVVDPRGYSDARWENAALTASCGAALDICTKLAIRYNFPTVPVGLLTLALVADGTTAAAQALGNDLGRADLLRLLQSDVLGMPLAGLDTVLPRLVAESATAWPVPVARPPMMPGIPGTPMSPGKPLFRRGAAIGILISLALATVTIVGIAIVAVRAKSAEPPHASDAAVTRVDDLGDGCRSRRTYFTRADAYAGNGPHPVAVFRISEVDTIDTLDTVHWDTDRPRQWMDVDAERTQLIVCLGKAGEDERLGQCDFRGHLVPIYRGRYDAVIYEAHTGARVGGTRLLGSLQLDCPFFALLPARSEKLHTEPDLDGIRAALSTYVDRALPGVATAPALTTDLTGLCRTLATQMPDSALIGSMGNVLPTRDTAANQSCTWDSDTRFVDVEVKAAASYGSPHAQASDNAKSEYDVLTSIMAEPDHGGGVPENLPGLGDQAAVGPTRPGSSSGAEVVVLIGNVTVQVEWTGQRLSYTEARDRAIELARKAVGLAVK